MSISFTYCGVACELSPLIINFILGDPDLSLKEPLYGFEVCLRGSKRVHKDKST